MLDSDEVEQEPLITADVFAVGIDRIRQFARNLEKQGVARGLIGPRELNRLWTRHMLNCGVVAPLMRRGRVIDVGSGGGLPGIPLAIARPDVEFILLEPMERRAAWLVEQVHDLGLTNVTVIRDRAQDAPLQGSADQVTARAVSALSKLVPLTAPLARPGGELILMKGAHVHAEITAARKQIHAAKLVNLEVLSLGEGLLEQTTTVVRATVDGE